MPLIEHLKELRVRLIRSLIAIAAGFAVAYIFVDQIFQLLTEPLREVSHNKVLLIGTGIGRFLVGDRGIQILLGRHDQWREPDR